VVSLTPALSQGERGQLENEYDGIYKKDPTKWTNPKRDAFTLEVITNYLESRSKILPSDQVGKPDLISVQDDKPKSVLDIGCGNGHTIKYFMDRWKHTAFYGLDLSREAVRLARKNCPMATIYPGFLGEVDFRQSFDLVMLLGTLEHFPEPGRALEMVRPLVAPGGIVYVECPNPLAYPGAEPQEGMRRPKIGTRQMEWHLRRESWEKIITRTFEIERSIKGPRASMEFIWILS
jgi:SAM-dependent methyltransferase